MDLTTDEGIQAYLTNIGYKCKTVEKLSGGFTNFVWRAHLEEDCKESLDKGHGTELIIKHAEKYLRVLPSVPMSTARMDIEANMLRNISPVVGAKPSTASQNKGFHVAGLEVYTPRVYRFDKDAYVLIMSSGGPKTLKDMYVELSGAQIHSIGSRLAQWLAKLHASSKKTDIGEGGNPTARKSYRFAYDGLERVLAGHGLGGEGGRLGKEVNETYGSLLATDDECVAQGEFWAANIIVDTSFLPADDDTVVPCTIVDWEMCRRGVAATDVAQFVAEAYMLDRFRDPRHGLAGIFLRSYIDVAKPNEKFLRRFGVHCGVHLAFWPSYTPWATKEQTRDVARVGVGFIEAAMAGSNGWLDTLTAEFDKYSPHAPSNDPGA